MIKGEEGPRTKQEATKKVWEDIRTALGDIEGYEPCFDEWTEAQKTRFFKEVDKISAQISKKLERMR